MRTPGVSRLTAVAGLLVLASCGGGNGGGPAGGSQGGSQSGSSTGGRGGSGAGGGLAGGSGGGGTTGTGGSGTGGSGTGGSGTGGSGGEHGRRGRNRSDGRRRHRRAEQPGTRWWSGSGPAEPARLLEQRAGAHAGQRLFRDRCHEHEVPVQHALDGRVQRQPALHVHDLVQRHRQRRRPGLRLGPARRRLQRIGQPRRARCCGGSTAAPTTG